MVSRLAEEVRDKSKLYRLSGRLFDQRCLSIYEPFIAKKRSTIRRCREHSDRISDISSHVLTYSRRRPGYFVAVMIEMS